MKNHHHLGRMHMALAALLVTLVAACGGGSVLPNIERIVVVGDSLSDVGTFNGMKFTVQNAADESAGYPIWTQLTETAYGLDGNAQCNHYAWDSNLTNPQFVDATDAASCTNYAIGGAQIYAPSPLASEFNIRTQLEQHVSASGFNANDLLLIDGGGNDLAKLAELYLSATDDVGQTAFNVYVQTVVPNPDSDPAVAGDQYMAALASEFYQNISDTALQNGAQQVLVVNVPDITLTPRFLAVLAGQDAAKGVIRGWAEAFNGALKDLAENESRVVIADFFTQFNSQITNASAYGLTNVVDAACPADPDSPLGDLPACFDATLDQDTSNDRTDGWWKTYAFSDNFHPTPKGHELLAKYVKQTLKTAGWL